MYPSSFTVPTLALSSSRAKKHTTASIPTRDYPSLVPSYTPTNAYDSQIQNKYVPRSSNVGQEQQERPRRPPIFAPRTSATQAELAPRDINKNVYLQTQEQFVPNPSPLRQQQPYRMENVISNPPLRNSSSRGLLSNPESAKLIEQEMQQRNQARRLDVGRVLFDRKLSKLLQEASFYEEQLQSVCKDDIGPRFQELVSLKENTIHSHQELIQGLTALIR